MTSNDKPKPKAKSGMRLIEVLVVIAIVVVLAACTFDLSGLFESLSLAGFGWVAYLVRVVPRVRVDVGWLTTFLTFGLLTLIGIHLFGTWIRNKAAPSETGWRFSTSAAVFLGLVLLFTTGIAMVGVTHQTMWFFAGRDSSFSGGIRPSPRDRPSSYAGFRATLPVAVRSAA